MAENGTVGYAQFAFRKREKRFALVTTAITYFACSLLLTAGIAALAWPHLGALVDWYMQVLRSATAGAEPPGPPMDALTAILPFYGLVMILSIMLYAAFEAACLRWMLRGERGGLFGLSLGADTWRVLATYLVWFVLVLGFCVVVALFYFAIRALGQALPALGIVVMLIGALAPLLFFAMMIWGAVRLSPAAALTVARRKFSFAQTWAATRGQFWEMLGAFVIIIVGYIVVSTIIGLPVRGASEVAMYSAMSGAADARHMFEALRNAFSTPAMMATLALYMLASVALSLVLYVTWFGVNARAVSIADETKPPS